jgi:hypothetical protein
MCVCLCVYVCVCVYIYMVNTIYTYIYMTQGVVRMLITNMFAAKHFGAAGTHFTHFAITKKCKR